MDKNPWKVYWLRLKEVALDGLLSMMRHHPVWWEESAKRPVSLPLQLQKAGLEEEFRLDKKSGCKLSASFYFTRTRRIKEPGKTEAKGYKNRPPPSGAMRFYWSACQCCAVHTLKSLETAQDMGSVSC